jgi:hypothetical protein
MRSMTIPKAGRLAGGCLLAITIFINCRLRASILCDIFSQFQTEFTVKLTRIPSLWWAFLLCSIQSESHAISLPAAPLSRTNDLHY